MVPYRFSVWFALALGSSVLCTTAVGCSSQESEEEDGAGDNDAALTTATELNEEVALLGGSQSDLQKLLSIVDKRVSDLEAKKANAKVQAKADVESYTAEQWQRSFFRPDEKDDAIDARSKDIFDRPDRRALSGAKAQHQFVAELSQLVASRQAGTLEEPSARAVYLRKGYIEVAISIKLSDDTGFGGQLMARIEHILEKAFPWLGKVFKGLQRDHRAEGLDGEAVDIDRSGPQDQLWKRDPVGSTAWTLRRPEEVTPANLYRGPWYNGTTAARVPKAGELWGLAGFRSQASDGSHPNIVIKNGNDSLHLKMRDQQPVFEEGPNSRLMWALGYETDPNYIIPELNVEPRVLVAADATVERMGIKFGSKDDEIVPGRPPIGLSITVNPLKKAPGGENITIRFKDGHSETGDQALDSVKRAMKDRPFLDSMDIVTLRNVFGETDAPYKRDACGLWDFDADSMVDNREVRAVSIILGAWLGNSDVKFNNNRLDVELPKTGGARYIHAMPDVGHLTSKFGFTVDIDPKGEFLHPDMNVSTVRAFDRTTTNDAKWAVAKIASLSEEQIFASVAAGAFSDEGAALYTEKLVSRRDSLVKAFGLEAQFPLLRPQGPNESPAPRHFDSQQ